MSLGVALFQPRNRQGSVLYDICSRWPTCIVESSNDPVADLGSYSGQAVDEIILPLSTWIIAVVEVIATGAERHWIFRRHRSRDEQKRSPGTVAIFTIDKSYHHFSYPTYPPSVYFAQDDWRFSCCC